MIRKSLATILFLASVPICCVAHLSSEARIDSAKPTVYLALERLEENGRIWLRLHNNTRWAINLRTKNPGAVLVPLTLISGQTVCALADGSEVSPISDRECSGFRLW